LLLVYFFPWLLGLYWSLRGRSPQTLGYDTSKYKVEQTRKIKKNKHNTTQRTYKIISSYTKPAMALWLRG